MAITIRGVLKVTGLGVAIAITGVTIRGCNADVADYYAKFKVACEAIPDAKYVGGHCRKKAQDYLCDNSFGWTYLYSGGECTRIIDNSIAVDNGR